MPFAFASGRLGADDGKPWAMRSLFAHRGLQSSPRQSRHEASRLFSALLRMPLVALLVMALAWPRVSWAAQDWPFDPQERYDNGLAAFDNQDYGLATELWMDILSNPKSSDLGTHMVRLIGENILSALSASLKSDPENLDMRTQASRFCDVYTRLHEGDAFSESIQDACVDWATPPVVQGPVTQTAPTKAAPLSKEPVGTPPEAVTSEPPVLSTGSPLLSPRRRSPQLKAGVGMLLTAALTSGVSVVGIVLEGNYMRDYHTSIFREVPDTRLRDRSDGWRTVAVVSGGVSLALVAVGTLLCLSGTRTKRDSLAQGSRRGFSLNGRGFSLRF